MIRNFEELNAQSCTCTEALKAKLADGSVVVDNNSDDNVKPTVSDLTTVNYIG